MLQRLPVEVPFAAGLDTKTDGKLVLSGKLLTLQNGIFTKGGTIQKRNGYTALGKGIVGGSVIASGLALATFNDELLLFDSTANVYSYVQGKDAWIGKGTAIPLLVDNAPIVRNTASQSAVDAATYNGITVYVWADTRNGAAAGIRASVFDEATGAALVSDTQLTASATAKMPRVVVASGKFLITYLDSTNIRVRTLDPVSPLTFTAEVTPITDVAAANAVHDLVATIDGSQAVFAYTANATNVKVGYLTITGTIPSPTPVSIAEAGIQGIAVVLDPVTAQVWVGYANATQGFRIAGFNTDLTTKQTATTVDASVSVVNVTGLFSSSSQMTWFYEVTAAATYNHFTKTNTVTTAGGIGTAAVLRRGVGLASKAFAHSTGNYAVCVQDSTLQATYFLVRADGAIAGRFLQGQASGVTANSLPKVLSKTSDVWLFPSLNKTRFLSQANTVFTLVGVSRTTLTFNSLLQYLNGQLGQALFIAGGFLNAFDGQSIVEAGFHLYPENASVALAGSGGSLSAGAYQWVVVYEWIDNKGQIHRSSPSLPIPATAVNNDKATLTIPTLRLTARQSPRTNVMIAVYRTVALGTTFFKVSSNTAPLYNDPTVDTVSFQDGTADTSIQANEILYTSGGTLPNDAPPPSPIMAVTKNRVWLLDLDKRTLWYSKATVAGRALEFTAFSTLVLDNAGGAVQAIAAMDDKVIVFKKDRIYFVAGDGPDDTGLNGLFTPPALITTDVGCTQPLSVATTPGGLMFMSDKGLYRLGRDLSVAYVGAAVEAFNSLAIASGDLVEGANQVRFISASGTALVYDYHFDQWSTFTNHGGTDAIIWGGVYSYLRADGTVYQEAAGTYQDAGADIHLLLETAWVKTAGIQGFQRVRRAAFLGNFLAPHKLNVKVAYDYQPFTSEEHNFDPSAALSSSTWGSDATWGSGAVWGGVSDVVYQLQFRPLRQKCQAIKFTLADIGSNPGGGFSISMLTLEAAVKGPTPKLPAAKVIS